ncbi:MAG: SGNH/GDSL hydrolase family protein [Candidatus Hydrogenedentes bacterium]|nr:SGNH/GDSL hydrolase family protein [Candidatus Hydrogenedentota bacterium]
MTEDPSITIRARNRRKLGGIRAIVVNGTLALVTFGATLAAGEAFLRLSGFRAADYSHNAVMSSAWTDSDQLLGYVRKPNLAWRRQTYPDRFSPIVSYNTDANGFRNPPGIETADIAFIGDSFTEGGTMPLESTFPRLIERKLGASIVNLGRGGYGPPQELAVLWKYALPYRPQTVVWTLFEGNDLKDAQMYYNGKFRELTLPVATNWLQMGTIWFDNVQLHELSPPPGGDDWYYRAAPFLNEPERFAERHVTGGNLVRNGSFEKELRESQWQVMPALRDAVQRVTPKNRQRKNSFALQVEVPAYANVGIAQAVSSLKPSTCYLLSGRIRTKDVLGPARLEVQQRDNSTVSWLRFTPGVSKTHDWTHVSLVFKTPAIPGDVRIVLRRPANPPKPRQGVERLKLVQLANVAMHQGERLRARLGLTGTFDSAEYGETDVGFDYKYAGHIDDTCPQGWMVTSEMLCRGHELCQENGIRLLVVYLPIALRVHGPYSQFDADAPLTDYVPGGDWNATDEFAERTAALCAEQGIQFIDATGALRDGAAQREFVYAPRYDSHLYYRGHEIVANLIAAALETQAPR